MPLIFAAFTYDGGLIWVSAYSIIAIRHVNQEDGGLANDERALLRLSDGIDQIVDQTPDQACERIAHAADEALRHETKLWRATVKDGP